MSHGMFELDDSFGLYQKTDFESLTWKGKSNKGLTVGRGLR